jgi:hypothetical protein
MASSGRSQRSNNKPGGNEGSDNSAISTSLLDDPSMDRLEVILTKVVRSMVESFNSSILQLSKMFEDKLQNKLDFQTSELFTLNTEIDVLTRTVEALKTENTDLRLELSRQAVGVKESRNASEELEQYTKNQNLLIHGVPLPANGQNEDLYQLIPNLLNSNMPGQSLSPEMISIAHRLSSARTSAPNGSTNPHPPPIIVRFIRRVTRDGLLANRKLLKGKRITLTEHLTTGRSQLLKKASALATARKIDSAWSKDGKIIIKTLQHRFVTVTDDSALDQFS